MRSNAGRRRLAAAVMAATLVTIAPAGAQPRQTAEGAQRFLGMLVGEGTVPAVARFGEVKVQYSYRIWERKLLRGWIDHDSKSSVMSQMREVPAQRIGAPDPCTTVIEALAFGADDLKAVEPADFNAEYYASEARWTPSFAVAMAPPHAIAWGRANVVRDQHGVMATLPDPKFGQVSLIFRTTSPEMLDRLEYAMKFLQMSCDATADTGF